jgi:hypothetical protein
VRVAASGFALVAMAACTAPQPSDQKGALEPDDGWGGGIEGGYDINADPIRASWELGVNWSDHQAPADVDLAVTRVLTGLRFTGRLQDVPLGAYVRGGWMWRDANSDDNTLLPDNDMGGWYAGAGLEWWYIPTATLGPFVMYTRGSENDVDETWIGIAARFYLTE